MTFADRLLERAGPLGRTIAFPEGDDPRVVAAAGILAQRSVVRPVLLREGEGGEEGGAGAAGSTLQTAAAMLRAGRVDGVVAGAAHTTARVIRTALGDVGLRDGVRTLSSSFFMEVPAFRGSGAEVLTFTDPAVVPRPGPRRLAEIAAEAVRLRRQVVGDEPRVAFLSYSTLGSAGGRPVEAVREAVERFRARLPGVAADGELQADAALVPAVARAKAPDSVVGGGANILVFPNLDAANIAYKLVQRLAGAVALGPILQGLRAPVNDLSRGASSSDIVLVAAITALMASEPG
ncbi:MAG: phosphate acyltransferase [Gemmatimonadota bacterium]|nr:phosphate acyltransferase [Gemmatimonadota bacterium]